LDISGTTSFSDVNNVLQTLGILVGGQSDVAEIHTSDTANTKTTAGTDDPVDAATKWGDIDTSGDGSNTNNVTNDDSITISGTNHDGASVSGTYTIVDTTVDTMQGLLDKIETVFGLDAGSATINADGKIVVTDSTAGDSALSVSLIANNEGGGTLDLGTLTASTEGYTMQTAEGKDANIKIDGTTITGSTNVITDVISGVTINLKKVESGSQVDLNISRELDSIKSSVQSFIDKYNEILEYINGQFAWDEDTQSAGLLSGDGTLSSVKSSLQNILVSTIKDLPTDMNALSLIGINSDMNGVLSLNDSDFTNALVSDFTGGRRIFVGEGTTTDGDISYISHARETVAGDYAVVITTAAEQAAITGVTDLSGGIASDETMVITKGNNTATIALDDTGNGQSIDDIVNAINSELDTVYTELWTGTNANTEVGGGAIISSTVWEDIDTEGGSNLVTNGDTISFSGKTRSGTSISGAYTIDDKTTDTVQGLLSAIEDVYGNNVSANIDSNGKLIITDNTAGNSQLEISVTCNNEGGGSLDFGTMEVTTEGRYAMAVTASKDAGNHLVMESDDYGSSVSFTVKQYATVSGAEEITGDVVNTSVGVNITGLTAFDEIDGYTAGTGDTIKINGIKHDGTVIDEVVFAVYDSDTLTYKDIDALLAEIGTALGGTATVVGGKIKLTDDTTGASLMTLTLTEPAGLDFGTFSASTGIINGSDSGVDVAGTINGEAATGSGRVLTGDAPATGETTSVEGLSVKATLTPDQLVSQGGNQGNVKITMGAAEKFDRELYGITDPYDGYVAFKQTSLQNSIDSFETQIEQMEAFLDRKMETMINRFVAMELALSKIQNQSDWLTGQINASFSGWGW
ncbi:MAG: flagellar filament capping protein FliD, partial [Spirochaetales bacterium]|nr:flagellar filament capping protein FliD [Spirochaetales bacterium]